jgi:thioesterase domain-containing protein
MAQQLQARGEKVALLACFDSLCPTIVKRRSKLGRLKTFASGLAHGRGDYIAFVLKRRLSSRHAAPLVDTLPEEESELVRDLELAFIAAQERYETRPLDAHMVLFQASDRSEIALSHIPDDFGWKGLLKQGIETVQVPGRHTTLVLEPNVRVLAAGLRGAIERAMRNGTH